MDSATSYNLAFDKFNEGKYQAAVNYFDKALELDPQGIRVPLAYIYINRGKALTNLECYEKALSDFNQALAIAPEYAAHICWDRGLVYQKLERYEEAFKDLQRAAALFLSQGDRKSHQIVTMHLTVLKAHLLNLLNKAYR